MSCVLELLRALPSSRVAALALIMIGVAGCSSEYLASVTIRSSPEFQRPPARSRRGRARRSHGWKAQPLPQPPHIAPLPASRGAGSPPSPRPVRSTPSADQFPRRVWPAASAPAASGHWSWDGGTAVTVAQGETVETIARRHGVPASAIIQANGLSAPAAIHPGQQLVIPRYSQSPVAAAGPASPCPFGAATVAETGRGAKPAIRGCTSSRRAKR